MSGRLSDADILTSVRLIHRPDWSAFCRGCGLVDNEYIQPWPCETAELFLDPRDHAAHPDGCQCSNLAGDCCPACHADA